MTIIICGVLLVVLIFIVAKIESNPNAAQGGVYNDTYTKYRKECSKLFQDTRFYIQAQKELPVLLYTVGKIGIALSGHGSEDYLNQVKPSPLFFGEKEEGENALKKRIQFYKNVQAGDYVCGVWSIQGIPQALLQNPVNKATAAFGDLLITDDVLDDYEGCAMPLLDIHDHIILTKIMYSELMDLVNEYVQEISRL